MDQRLISLAFAAGLVAALNPCGFALLPAYLVLVVRREGTAASTGLAVVGRALAATAAMGLGFLTVFGAFGALTVSAGGVLQRYLPYVTVVIGVVIVALGGWLLAGRELRLSAPWSSRLAPTARLGSMYGYGVSYAIASLSCTVGPFLAVTTAGLRRQSLIGSVAVYLAYIAGLTLVVGVLAVAAATASSAAVTRLRRILPYVNRFGGALLIAVGLYVAYYAYYEIALLAGAGPGPDAVLTLAARVQGTWSGWVLRHGGWPWVWALAFLLTGAGVAAAYRRKRRPVALAEPAAPTAPPVAHQEEQAQ